jgi:glycosyltransferase involved in cell wall biosynthesis
MLRRERPDVVHTHAWGTLIEGIVASKLAGVPAIVHGEHGTLQTRPGQIRAQRWGWKSVNRVLSVSSRLAERMAAQVGFPIDRISTIRNGVDLTRFNRDSRAEGRQHLGLARADLTIGTVGRLVDVKDHASFLSALALLRRRVPNFKAFIAGEGPLREALEHQLQDLGLSDSVHLVGHQGKVERLLSALDIFVLSSKSEGLSNTIQEAMACGVAVVATKVGGADELVLHGETGLLVPAQDPEALAGALEVLGRNAGLRKAMGEAGGLRARREFSVDRMIQQYEDLYLELGAARGSEKPAGVRASQGLPG